MVQSFMPLDGASSLDRCDIGSGNVVFLAGVAPRQAVAERECTISSKKSILVPLINVECSVIEGDGATSAERREKCRGIAYQFTDLSLTIDGSAVPNLTSFRVVSGDFKYTMGANNPFGAVPDPNGPPVNLPADTLAVSDGYWALIPPLSIGLHTISFGGHFGDFQPFATYHLTVKK